MRILTVDQSDWQTTPLDYNLLRSNGVRSLIVKASMGGGPSKLAGMHVAAARAAGLTIGLYHWDDPLVSTTTQLKYLEAQIKALNPNYIAIDVEQWWADWNAYHLFANGKIPRSSVPVLGGNRISDHAYQTLQSSERFNLPLLNYTANWFINGFASSMLNWIKRWPLWLAEYYWSNGSWATWESFQSSVNGLTAPKLPSKDCSWVMWQFTATKNLPGQRDTDVNIVNGALEYIVGNTAPVEQEPTEEVYTYICRATYGMIVRKGAYVGANDSGLRIKYKQQYSVYTVKAAGGYTWGLLDPEKDLWVALDWSVRI